MNVVETLELANKMIKLDDRCNTEILNFYSSILITEAKILDSRVGTPLEEATDVTMVMTFLHDRCVGKKNIFASKIIMEGYNKLITMCEDRIICESFIFSTSLLESEEVIKERDYFVSTKGLEEFVKELTDHRNEGEEGGEQDGES